MGVLHTDLNFGGSLYLSALSRWYTKNQKYRERKQRKLKKPTEKEEKERINNERQKKIYERMKIKGHEKTLRITRKKE